MLFKTMISCHCYSVNVFILFNVSYIEPFFLSRFLLLTGVWMVRGWGQVGVTGSSRCELYI